MAKKAKADKAAAEGAKKGKGKLLIILIAVLALGGGGAYFVLFSGTPSKAAAAAALAKLPAPTYAFPSTLTTNLSDGHLLQVGMTFQLTKTSLPADIAPALPQVTDAAIQTLGAYSYTQLLSPATRVQAKTALIQVLNPILKKAVGKPQITDIFFTSFLMQ